MPTPNTTIHDRYLVERPLAASAGAVWIALDLQTRARVALKAAPAGLPEETFDTAARALFGLRHPNLPAVREYFVDGGRGYVVMDLVARDADAGDAPYIATPLPAAEGRRWATRLLDALDYIHTLAPPLIHGDIRPEHVRVDRQGEPVLLGFGLGAARAYAADDPFAAPELLGGAAADARSDLYALAATLYQLLAGQAPAPAAARQSALAGGQADPLAPPRRLNPAIPAALSEGLVHALALDPAARPASAGALLDATDYVPQLPPAPPPARQIPRWALALGALVVLLLAGLLLRGAFGGGGAAAQQPTLAPAAAEPTATAAELATAEPVASEPTAAEPTAAEPTASEPTAAEPTAAEPTASEPTAAEPTASEPTAAEPTATASAAAPQGELAAVQGVLAQYTYTSRVATDGTGAYTRMRAQPDAASAPIGTLRNGDQVEVLETNAGGWLHVRIHTSADATQVGVEGWIERWLVDNQNAPKPAVFVGKVYSAPTDSAAQCGSVFESSIYGSVEDAGGRGIPGAKLRVRSADGRNTFPITTGKGGVYTVGGLGCTAWRVELLSVPGAKGLQANVVAVRNLNGGKFTSAEVRFKLQP
ncbi:protein kinase domain-containing protein [Kouleothrix sp.]|uniref:protein kinase domain-containing protein n=1 Tax=Kouleothrix sp. TaxID=2779161 RepID=UPI00391C7470